MANDATAQTGAGNDMLHCSGASGGPKPYGNISTHTRVKSLKYATQDHSKMRAKTTDLPGGW